MPVETLIQVRRGTNTNWSTVNPTLSSGEFGFESNTGRLKIGNGSQTWSVLPYLPDTLDALLDVVVTSPLNGQLLQFNGTNWVNASSPSGEPIGHTDKSQSVMSFSNATRTFSISPASTSFEVWCVGRRFTFTAAQTVQIPNTSGLYYIYFDSAGVLSQKTTFFTWDADTPTAYVYWNATDGEAYFFADERHGITLDWQTHEYLHRTRGAAYASGFSIGAYTITGTGAANADMQLDIADGTFFDEDLQVDITHSSSPTANTWQQVLQGGAEIPIFYRSGSVWKRTTPTKYPLKQGTLAQYNLNTAGNWSTPDLATNKYGVTWIVATNNLTYPVIGLMGQNQYDNLNKVAEDTWAALDLANLPIFEIRPLWKVAYLVSSGFANTPKAAIREVVDLRVVGSTATGLLTTPTDHGSLYGLSDDDHTQYFNQTRGDARYLQLTGGSLSGALSVTGTVSGTTFSGSGASLTSIPNSATTATSANTASAIVARDASGNFTASTITATTFSGSGASLTNVPNSATTATSANTASAIVARDASGNFTAGTITATTFSGSGASLTGLPAAQLTGTVNTARLSGSYTGITNVGTLLTSSAWSNAGWTPALRATQSILLEPNVASQRWLLGTASDGRFFLGYNTAGDASQAPNYPLYIETNGVIKLNNTTDLVGGPMNIYQSNECLRLAGTNPYIGFWNSTITTRVAYFQGVNGDSLRLVTDTGSNRLYIGTEVFHVRNNALAADRFIVTSTYVGTVLPFEFSNAGTPTSDGAGVIRATSDGSRTGITIKSASASNVTDFFTAFYDTANGSTAVGSIFSPASTSTTTYQTTSDYRLKRDDTPLVGSLERVLALRPISYRWERFADSPLEEGFFAHEVQEIVPCAAFGEKDAEDEDGNIVAQQMELSRLVPVLVGAVQELAERVAALEGLQ